MRIFFGGGKARTQNKQIKTRRKKMEKREREGGRERGCCISNNTLPSTMILISCKKPYILPTTKKNIITV